MKPAAFEYLRPDTLKEALTLLDEYGFDAKVLAGGQSLIPMMNMRLARPPYLIDINKLKELDYIRLEQDQLVIGGLTRHFTVELSPVVKEHAPMLAEGMKLIGHAQIRSRGTIGGSIVHADPTAELPVMLTALEGRLTVESNEGERVLEPDEFFLTYLTTTIEPNEILTKISIPIIQPRSGQAIEEFTLRKGDFAIVLAAASVTLDEAGAIEKAILCVGGVDGIPIRLDEITDRLMGQVPDDQMIEEACAEIADWIEPEPDIHASAEYRKDLSVILSARAIKKAVKQATISASKGE